MATGMRSPIPRDLGRLRRPQRRPRRPAGHRVRLGDGGRATRPLRRPVSVNVATVVGNTPLRIAALGWDEVPADDAPSRTSGHGSARRWRTGRSGSRPGSTTRPAPMPRPRSWRRSPEVAAEPAGSTTPTSATRWATASSTRSGRRSRSGGASGAPAHITHFYHRATFPGRRSRCSRSSTTPGPRASTSRSTCTPRSGRAPASLIMLPTWIRAGGVAPLQGRLANAPCATGSAARCATAGDVRREPRVGRAAARGLTRPENLGGRAGPWASSCAHRARRRRRDLRPPAGRGPPDEPGHAGAALRRDAAVHPAPGVDDRDRRRAHRRQAVAAIGPARTRGSSGSSCARSAGSALRRRSTG